MSEAELEVVFDYFHARRRRDIDAVAATLSGDVVHQGVQPDLVCNGRDEVVERVRTTMRRANAGIDRIELVDAGAQVVVGLSGPAFRDNPLLDGELYMVFTVRDGVITRIDDYRTRPDAVRAAQQE
ncbi:MAG: nuclear transport factor 2 family protein [Candidatus Dormibacteraeota bacterium]|nr:nuclear transport factor 2 family protein [Candidatus Dormibacteraeota bacterium]MBV8444379.1 nuclear transport factor 2 family protein [Candidatus Dormibacteraeota bacterium]